MKSNLKNQFEKLYEPWEAYLKVRYPEGESMDKIIKKFSKDEKVRCEEIKASYEDLRDLLQIRNVEKHRSSFIAIKTSAVQKLKMIVNAFCRKATDIATSEKKIYKGTLNSYVSEVVKTMHRNLYTHVPIVNKKDFVGAFSENTLLKLIASAFYRPNMKMKDIKKFLKTAKGADDYLFLPLDTDFYTVYKLFQDYIDKRKRLGVIFLTKNGRPSNQIKGLITSWDLHKGIS